MTRQAKPPRADAVRNQVDCKNDRLQLPDDWDDAANLAATHSECAPHDSPDLDDAEDNDDGSTPPKLVQAMLALNRAKIKDDIAAARAILRVTGF